MRFGLACFALACLASSGSAQLLAVIFKDPKDANKYKEHLVSFRGTQVIVGEPFKGVTIDFEKNEITKSADKPLEFLVADSGDPSKVPYKFEGDVKVVSIKKQLVSIPGLQVEELQYYDRSNNLVGLAADYADKKALIDELEKERDACARNSPEWMSAHRRAVSAMERLRSWLDESLFADAAKKVGQEILRERKQIDEALAARGIAAKASIKPAPTPETLVTAAQEISGGADKFKVQESLHARIVYRDGIPDARVHELLVLVEEIIEGFRVEFVDPYADAAFEDHIPERMFVEWWFGPDDIDKHDRYYTDFYGQNWGDKKKERLETKGTGARRSMGPAFLHYWRTDEFEDLEGVVAHNLGHTLSSVHYDKTREGSAQPWLNEAVGYYLAFEWLGRNSVSCKAFAKDSVYAHQVKKEGEKTLQEGLRDWFNALAVESGPAIDRLATKSLFEMGDADLAKSWSFYDYLARKTGKQGQQFLRAACNTERAGKTFINDWRAKSEEIFEIKGQDVFTWLDKRWREYALVGQETGDARRKK